MKKIIIAVASLTLLSACATTSSIDKAQATADKALAAAHAAQECCTASTIKLDNMFKKSMMK